MVDNRDNSLRGDQFDTNNDFAYRWVLCGHPHFTIISIEQVTLSAVIPYAKALSFTHAGMGGARHSLGEMHTLVTEKL